MRRSPGHEEQYRAMLRLSLESDPGDELPRRLAYRQQWLTDALAPLRDEVDRPSFHRLLTALSLCVGIEAHIALRDVCGLPPAEARKVKVWTARTLLRAAISDAKQTGPTTQAQKPRARQASGSKRPNGAL